MKDSETRSKAKTSLHTAKASGNFQKALDRQNKPIRGLWIRNELEEQKGFLVMDAESQWAPTTENLGYDICDLSIEVLHGRIRI